MNTLYQIIMTVVTVISFFEHLAVYQSRAKHISLYLILRSSPMKWELISLIYS